MGKVTHETCVVDGTDRADAHGAGRELPKIRHQIRMRVTREAARALASRCGRCRQLLAVMHQVLLREAPFQKRAGINTGGTMGLQKHQIPAVPGFRGFIPGTEKMIEPHLKQIGSTGITGDVTTEFTGAPQIGLVGTHHHGQGIPAH